MNKNSISKFSFLICMLLVSMFCISGDSIGKSKKPVGSVVSWMGDVLIYEKGASKSRTVMSMEPLFKGDTVVTGKRSKAKLLMKDDSIISIAPVTRLVIKDYQFSEKKRKRVSLLKIISGTARGVINRFFSKKNSVFEIETPTAVVGVKGTDFIIKSDRKGTDVVTITGSVTAGSTDPSIGGEVLIKSGQISSIKQGQAPTTPEKLGKRRVGYLLKLMEETSIPVTHPLEIKEAGCIGCHKPVFTKMQKALNPHKSAMSDCKACHIKSASEVSGKKTTVPIYTKSGLIVLNVDENVSYNVSVTLEDREGKKIVSKPVGFTPKDVKARIKGSSKPINIEDFKLGELKGGVFYTGVFTWKSSRPTTSEIEYGSSSKNFRRKVANRDLYTTSHRVEIPNLPSDKKFTARVASKDAEGNTIYSEFIKFKTKKPFPSTPDKVVAGAPKVKSVHVVRLGKDVAVMWSGNKPTRATINVGKTTTSREMVSISPHYPGLTTKNYAAMGGCMSEGCHEGSIHKETSHPTGRVKWGNIRKPFKLPLAEGGAITCSTCHESHGGNFQHILRMKKQKLCDSCHNDNR